MGTGAIAAAKHNIGSTVSALQKASKEVPLASAKHTHTQKMN